MTSKIITLCCLMLVIFVGCQSTKKAAKAAKIPVTADEARAIAILGDSCVVTAGEASHAWQLPYPDTNTLSISFPPDSVLRRCAEENETGSAYWVLTYLNGLSLNEMRDKRGFDQKENPPAFYYNKWWQEADSSVLNAKSTSGYRLLNFKPWYTGTSWRNQEKLLANSGFRRADEIEVAEALFSIFLTTGKRLLNDAYHWGRRRGKDDTRVAVGYFTSFGVGVNDGPEELQRSDLGVVIQR